MDFTVKQNGMTITVEMPDYSNKETIEKSAIDACKAIRSFTGKNKKEFAEWLGVSYRTYQDWERGVNTIPEYVLHLMAFRVRVEKELKDGVLVYADPNYKNQLKPTF